MVLGNSPLRVLPSKTAIVPVSRELMPRSDDEVCVHVGVEHALVQRVCEERARSVQACVSMHTLAQNGHATVPALLQGLLPGRLNLTQGDAAVKKLPGCMPSRGWRVTKGVKAQGCYAEKRVAVLQEKPNA